MVRRTTTPSCPLHQNRARIPVQTGSTYSCEVTGHHFTDKEKLEDVRVLVVAWTGRHGRGGPVVLQDLRDGGVAKGPDGTRGFRLVRTERVGRVKAVLTDASRLVGGMRQEFEQVQQELGRLWEAAKSWWRESQGMPY